MGRIATPCLSGDDTQFPGFLADGTGHQGARCAVLWWESAAVRAIGRERVRPVDRLVESEARLLLLRGRFLPDAMRRARAVEGEILAAARSHGIASLDGVEAVVLETDGSFSVVPRAPPPGNASAAGAAA